MRFRMGGTAFAVLAILSLGLGIRAAHGADSGDLKERLAKLRADVQAGEDIQAIKKLQKAYGFYLDKGMWEDLANLFADDAVANYPAGVYVGKKSIREHVYMNVGGHKECCIIGLGDGRLYNHMNIQPVVHLDPDGKTAYGRWRALATFGSPGGLAVWAEGVYEMVYTKDHGVWKIEKLDYYSGFGGSYDTGWAAPPPPPKDANGEATERRRSFRRNLPHASDRPKPPECGGFPKACIPPFHYKNLGTTEWGKIWRLPADLPAADESKSAMKKEVAELAHRAQLLDDKQTIENLQRRYGYYLDRAMWDQVADMFADNGTIEMGQQGVYVGKNSIRRFLGTFGPAGLRDGWLFDHYQLQIIADVAPDGMTAKSRSREFDLLGHVGGKGYLEEGTFENTYVKENGVWKIKSLHFYPTFITDYDKGWGKDAEPVPTASKEVPPDRPPTEVYQIYPKAYVPAYHYRNPVAGDKPHYPKVGAPSEKAQEMALAMSTKPPKLEKVKDLNSAIAKAEHTIQRVKAYDSIENLESGYGYYLDKALYTDLANLFSKNSSIELAQRGVYKGFDHVKGMLLKVFGHGHEGPSPNVLLNHLQLQPVIDVGPDNKTAKIRSRVWQQMAFGQRASWGGGIYENEAVLEDGVWKLSKDHVYNTFTAPYKGGWTKVTGLGKPPGPSKDYPPDGPPTLKFTMFPNVYNIPFHYAHPVTGSTEITPVVHEKGDKQTGQNEVTDPNGIPPEIEAKLRTLGSDVFKAGKPTTDIYTALQPKEPYSGVSVSRDLKYGPDERNVADVFTSPDKGKGKPVVVFVHGGGFSRGSKHEPGSPFFDNVGLWANSNGMVGVTISYRLAPAHQYPSGVEDLTKLVSWLQGNIAQYGGDPNKIFLWGHSAGAAHVGDYVAAVQREGKTPVIAGAILTSGFYELPKNEVSIWKSYYGEDISKYPEMSSLPWLVKSPTPLLVTNAELDPESFKPQTTMLVDALKKAGKPVTYLYLKGHNHLSELDAVNTSDHSLSGPVLSFVKTVSAREP